MTIAFAIAFKQLSSSPKKDFQAFFHGLTNSIDWSALHVWVFIAQLVEHCSVNAEATGSNSVEAPKIHFFWLLRNCLNCAIITTAMVKSSFHCVCCLFVYCEILS